MRMRAVGRPAKHGGTQATARCAAAAALHCYRAPQPRRVQSRQALRLTSRSSRTYPLPAQEHDQASHLLHDSGRRAASILGASMQCQSPMRRQALHSASGMPTSCLSPHSNSGRQPHPWSQRSQWQRTRPPPSWWPRRPAWTSTAAQLAASRCTVRATPAQAPSSKLHDQASITNTVLFPPRPPSPIPALERAPAWDSP